MKFLVKQAYFFVLKMKELSSPLKLFLRLQWNSSTCETTLWQQSVGTFNCRFNIAMVPVYGTRTCKKVACRKWADKLISVNGRWYNVLTPELFCSDKFEAEFETSINLCMGRDRQATNLNAKQQVYKVTARWIKENYIQYRTKVFTIS